MFENDTHTEVQTENTVLRFRCEDALRLIKAWVTLPLTHIFHKIENNLAILRGIFLILGRNVYHYHLSRTELWQRNMILSTAKNS